MADAATGSNGANGSHGRDTSGGGNGASGGEVAPRRIKRPKRRARPNSQLTHKMRAKGYLLATEVAFRVGVHKATVYRWLGDGVIEALDFNGAYYIRWESVREHLGELADILGLPGQLDGPIAVPETPSKASAHG